MKKQSIKNKQNNDEEIQSLNNYKDNIKLENKEKNNTPLKEIIIYLSAIFFFIILFILIIDLNINHDKNIYSKRKKNNFHDFQNNNKIINEKEKEIINPFLNFHIHPKNQSILDREENKSEYYNKLKNKEIIYEPIFPITNDEQLVTEFNITPFDKNNIRYHFRDIYFNREIFKINYSPYPYTKINKSLTYEENANIIYNSTGMINITKLNYYYYGQIIDTSKFNHINLGMGFDKNYLYMSTVSIAGILNTSSPFTYIHLHLCVNYFTYEDMQKIIQLNKINKNIEFIFYNGRQAELDFLHRARNEYLGIGDYNRVLLPQIVNNTNKLLILDSGDVLAYKDLSEIYFFDLGDNYFGWILDSPAGNIYDSFDKLFGDSFYSNSGVCLVNIRKFRKENLYERAFFTAFSYRIIPLPFQDIILMISDYKIKIFPLIYNCKQFYDYKEQLYNRNKTTDYIMRWIHRQKFSPFKYTKDEIYEAAKDPVIVHLYEEKIQNGVINKEYTTKWLKYVNLTGFYKEIKERYPIPFQKYESDLDGKNTTTKDK